METTHEERLLRVPEVSRITGLSRTMLYNGMKNGSFPKPIKLGDRVVAWPSSKVQAWVHETIARAAEA